MLKKKRIFWPCTLNIYIAVMISFYILSKRLFLKCEELYARVVSITKKEYGFAVHFFV